MENISPVKSNTLQCTNKIVIYSQVNGLVFYMFQFTKKKKWHKLKAINITVFKKIIIYVDNMKDVKNIV